MMIRAKCLAFQHAVPTAKALCPKGKGQLLKLLCVAKKEVAKGSRKLGMFKIGMFKDLKCSMNHGRIN